MKHAITCQWNNNLEFETKVNGHSIILDVDESMGGKNRGPRPNPLLLSSLAGCTGIDVIMILKKMRIEPTWFNINIEAELNDEEPAYYNKITIIYEFKESDNLNHQKVEKAVKLSEEKYCGVSAMLGKAAELNYRIQYL
ncbi:MAG: OsmC family protein [Bacteroidales bacterium]|jgi:putative redox protein|nr:OsmC family protein [Bacteroidales bacterium]